MFTDPNAGDSSDFFEEGEDDGQYIPDDEKPDSWPWEIIVRNNTQGGGRRRRLQDDGTVALEDAQTPPADAADGTEGVEASEDVAAEAPVDGESGEETVADETAPAATATNSTEADTSTTEPPRLNADTSTYISNPIICKTLGSAILWENLSPEKYPIYVKDSLLNTNDDFDFGEFEELPDLLSSTNAEAFVFTFTQPGIYVFSDSRNQAKQMILAIMGEN